MKELPYTEEYREKLKSIAMDSGSKRKPLSEATGALILDALGEQQNIMQAILGEIRDKNKPENCTRAAYEGESRIQKFVQCLNEETLEEIEKALEDSFGAEVDA